MQSDHPVNKHTTIRNWLPDDFNLRAIAIDIEELDNTASSKFSPTFALADFPDLGE